MRVFSILFICFTLVHTIIALECNCVFTKFNNGVSSKCTNFPYRTNVTLEATFSEADEYSNCKVTCLNYIDGLYTNGILLSNIKESFCQESYFGNQIHFYIRPNPEKSCSCIHSGYTVNKSYFCSLPYSQTYTTKQIKNNVCDKSTRDETGTSTSPSNTAPASTQSVSGNLCLCSTDMVTGYFCGTNIFNALTGTCYNNTLYYCGNVGQAGQAATCEQICTSNQTCATLGQSRDYCNDTQTS